MDNLHVGSSFRSVLSPFHMHRWVSQSFWGIKVSFQALVSNSIIPLTPTSSAAHWLTAYSGHPQPGKPKPQAENPCFKIRSFNAGLRLLKLCIWRVIRRNILYLLDDIIHLQEDKEAYYIFAQISLLDKGWLAIPACSGLSKLKVPCPEKTLSPGQMGLAGDRRITQTALTNQLHNTKRCYETTQWTLPALVQAD